MDKGRGLSRSQTKQNPECGFRSELDTEGKWEAEKELEEGSDMVQWLWAEGEI